MNTLGGERLAERGVPDEPGAAEIEAAGIEAAAIEAAAIEAAAAVRSTTIRALQQVLEVIDNRRPAAHLARSVTADAIERLGGLVRRPASQQALPTAAETARLIRVHLQMQGARKADYFGTFTRGSRVRAIAGRSELHSIPVVDKSGGRRCEERWVIVELSIV